MRNLTVFQYDMSTEAETTAHCQTGMPGTELYGSE